MATPQGIGPASTRIGSSRLIGTHIRDFLEAAMRHSTAQDSLALREPQKSSFIETKLIRVQFHMNDGSDARNAIIYQVAPGD